MLLAFLALASLGLYSYTALCSTQEIQPCGASSSNLRLGHSAWMVGPHTLCLPTWKAGNMTWYTWYTPECNKWNMMEPKSWRFGKWCSVSFPWWFWGSMFATHQLNWMTPKSTVNSYYMLIDLIPKSWLSGKWRNLAKEMPSSWFGTIFQGKVSRLWGQSFQNTSITHARHEKNWHFCRNKWRFLFK